MSACESSLWDLLEPDLQHSIRVTALNLQKSEAREKYQTIRKVAFAAMAHDNLTDLLLANEAGQIVFRVISFLLGRYVQ